MDIKMTPRVAFVYLGLAVVGLYLGWAFGKFYFA